jgi:signal transduction histidine kinase
MPAQISLRPMGGGGSNGATFGMVVTDMTEASRTEELLRALTHRVVQAQEAERGRVALELHDNIIQHLCAVHFRSQALADRLSKRDGPLKGEAMRLREMLGETAREAERIARDLRPGVLDQLGLSAVLRSACVEFADRTGVSAEVSCARLPARLPAGTELALYRILQEALKNVEKHARATHVAVSLRRMGAFVQLAVIDDGVGSHADHRAAARKGAGGLGLLGMRERAAFVGGSLKVESGRRGGTKVEVRVPVAGLGSPRLPV